MPESRVVLRNCEAIDPKDIRSYLKRDGFKALAKARNEMTPKKVIDEVKASGLRGPGRGWVFLWSQVGTGEESQRR